VTHLDIEDIENYKRLLALEEGREIVGGDDTPAIVVGTYILNGETAARERLLGIIDQLVKTLDTDGAGSEVVPHVDQADVEHVDLSARFRNFRVPAIIGAGLLDGVNPCAFTAIVFFVSFLAFRKYTRAQMVLVGGFFMLSVFGTYFLLGLGAFKLLQASAAYDLLSAVLHWGIVVLTLVLGVLSLVDYMTFRGGGDSKDVILKLPRRLNMAVHRVITRNIRPETGQAGVFALAGIAVATGFVVSLLEGACTGQMYVPTIAFVARDPELRNHALAYLALYNLMFIVPLVVVFLFGMFGVTSKMFEQSARRHAAKVKLATAIMFFALAALLIWLRVEG